VGEHLFRATGQDPFSYRTGRIHLVHPGQTDHKDATTVIRAPTTKTIDGTYTIRVDVTGRTSRGSVCAGRLSQRFCRPLGACRPRRSTCSSRAILARA
jgi:hypothetical protein